MWFLLHFNDNNSIIRFVSRFGNSIWGAKDPTRGGGVGNPNGIDSPLGIGSLRAINIEVI